MIASEKSFDQYLLVEYQNIAEAHFRSIAAISSFFRYYLLIMALPVTLVSLLIGLLSKLELPLPVTSIALSFSTISLVISIVGFLVMLYIINLRMDVVLYARTANGIRKYFYDHASLDIDSKLRTRTLPQSASLPAYFEKSYFGPVILTFGFFNTSYLVASLILPLLTNSPGGIALQGIQPWIWVVGVAFFSTHWVMYYFYSHHRELAYLKSFILGVDIDGVLNQHREHFCELLKQLVGKEVDPNKITTLPVRDDPALGVTREDEHRVFNDPRYWIDMPALADASYELNSLRNQFKLKVYIFTYRAWPTRESKEQPEVARQWHRVASESVEKYKPRSRFGRASFPTRLYKTICKLRLKLDGRRFGLQPIDAITKYWLMSNKITYDKLTVERGSEDVSDPRGQFRNRFYISRQKTIRFFVEDDPEKANKLSYICDVVFLYDQPYNSGKALPSNVVRVKSWHEVYQLIKRFS